MYKRQLQDLFGSPDGKPKGLKPAVRELFAGADVKDLGRGRYEITYSGFKDDKDVALFTVADGQVNLQRTAGGLGMQGTGIVTWTPALKGNASIEISFRNMGDGAMGLGDWIRRAPGAALRRDVAPRPLAAHAVAAIPPRPC